MMKIHGCKKCQGTLVLDKDEFGWYEQCMQCGYTRDIPLDSKTCESPAEDRIPVPVAADARGLVKAWKQNKIAYLKPARYLDGREEVY
jgi:hypothetical protein